MYTHTDIHTHTTHMDICYMQVAANSLYSLASSQRGGRWTGVRVLTLQWHLSIFPNMAKYHPGRHSNKYVYGTSTLYTATCINIETYAVEYHVLV